MARIVKSSLVSSVSKSYYLCELRIILYILIALAGAVFAIFTYGISLIALLFLLRIRRERTQMLLFKHGLKGEAATTAVLRGLPGWYYLCPDVTIQTGSARAQMDHVVVGPNGVFVVETKNHVGVISGDDEDYKLLQTKKNDSGGCGRRFYSPMRQVTTHANVMTRYLKELGFQVKAQGIVYFSHPKTKVRVHSFEIPVFSARKGGKRKLLRYIKRGGVWRSLSRNECKLIVRAIANQR